MALPATGSFSAARAETLNEALSAAYSYNPQLDAERATLRATEEGVAQQMSGFRPRVNATYEKNHTNLENTLVNPNSLFGSGSGRLNQQTWDIVGTQNLFNGWQTTFGIKSAEAAVRVGREQLRFREQDVLRQAVEGFMDTIRDESIIGLRENNVNVLGRELKATQDRFAVGEVTKTDVAQAQARRAQAIAALDAARANFKSSRAKFERVVGHPPDGLTEPNGYQALLPSSIDDALSVGERENPNSVIALYLEEQARHDVDRVRGELLPTVDLEARYTDTLEPSTTVLESERTSITGRVSVPLYEAGETYSRVREAKHRHVARLQQIEQARTEVREQVTAAWAQLQAARQQIESDAVSVQSSETALAGVREEERVGQRTLLDVLDAELELVQAQVQLATDKRNLVVNSYTLLQSVGRLEMAHLGAAPQVYDASVHADEVRRKWWGVSITHADGREEFLDLFRCCKDSETGSAK
jgi:outer membrane protein